MQKIGKRLVSTSLAGCEREERDASPCSAEGDTLGGSLVAVKSPKCLKHFFLYLHADVKLRLGIHPDGEGRTSSLPLGRSWSAWRKRNPITPAQPTSHGLPLARIRSLEPEIASPTGTNGRPPTLSQQLFQATLRDLTLIQLAWHEALNPSLTPRLPQRRDTLKMEQSALSTASYLHH